MNDYSASPSIIRTASSFAQWVHRDQQRKYTGQPYYVHLWEVAYLLIDASLEPEVVAAGYLHDCVEDQPITIDMLEVIFGSRVADLVSQVTDVSQPADGNRAARKAIDRAHLAKSDSGGASIKLADLISNTSTIVKFDPEFARVYLTEKQLLLPLLSHGDPGLFARAEETLLRAQRELGV